MIDSFKTLREQRLKEREEEQEKLLQLQNGQVSLSPADEDGPPEKIMGLDLSTWEGRSSQEQEGSLGPGQSDAQQEEEEEGAKSEERASAAELEAPAPVPADAAVVVVRERSRTLDEPSQKTTRAKRESRRMRELEQAKFSLELLKVRATGGGASPPSEERRWSLELVPSSPPFRSPQGTPDSQSSKGSFELLDLDEEPPKAVEEALDSEELCSPPPEADVESESSDAGHAQTDPPASPAAPHPPKIENYLPTFYVPEGGDGADISRRPAEEPRQNAEASVLTSETVTRPLKERRESTRRPVVVVISMQKEAPLKERLPPPAEGLRAAAQARESAPSPRKRTPAPALAGPVPTPTSANLAGQTVIEKLVRLNEEKEVRRRSQQRQNEKEMMEQIRQQKEALERQRLFFAQHERDMFEKQRGEALQKIQQSRHGERDRRAPRPGSLLLAESGVPHARPHSDSAPQPSLLREQNPQPQLPPPPASAPRERRRPPAEGWAPKLTLESREGVASRARAANRKPASTPARTSSLTEKPGNIFFSPKDKVTFAK